MAGRYLQELAKLGVAERAWRRPPRGVRADKAAGHHVTQTRSCNRGRGRPLQTRGGGGVAALDGGLSGRQEQRCWAGVALQGGQPGEVSRCAV